MFSIGVKLQPTTSKNITASLTKEIATISNWNIVTSFYLITVAKLAGHAIIQTSVRLYINISSKGKRNAVELL